MSRKKHDGMSVEDMREQLAMHKRALAVLEDLIVHEQNYNRHRQMEGTIEYHKYRISNYESMIKRRSNYDSQTD